MIIMIFILESCTHNFIFKNNKSIVKGISIADFRKSDIKIDEIYNLPISGNKYNCKIEIIKSAVRSATYVEIYYYAFRNDSLIYWGFPYQFASRDNEQLNDIAKEMYDILK